MGSMHQVNLTSLNYLNNQSEPSISVINKPVIIASDHENWLRYASFTVANTFT